MKSSKRVRVIAAIDENIFSQVAASILRNQDYDLVAIYLLIDLEKLGLNSSTFPSAMRKSNLTKIEKFCSGIDVPLRVIDVTEDVIAKVYDPFWMARLTGAPSAPRLDWVSGFLIPKLAELAKDFRAESFCTGHLARKLDEKPGGILRYSDDTDPYLDQSESFSRLKADSSSDVLDRLILPLGEVSLDRIAHLAQEMGLLKKPVLIEDDDEAEKIDPDLIAMADLLEEYRTRGRWEFTEAQLSSPELQARAPGDYFNRGPIRSTDEVTVEEHKGIPFYQRGDSAPEFHEQVVLDILLQSKTIIIGPKKNGAIGRAFLQNILWNLAPKNPIHAFPIIVSIFGERKWVEATLTLYPGGLGDLKLRSPLYGTARGTTLVFYEGSRVIGSAKIAETPKELSREIPIEMTADPA